MISLHNSSFKGLLHFKEGYSSVVTSYVNNTPFLWAYSSLSSLFTAQGAGWSFLSQLNELVGLIKPCENSHRTTTDTIKVVTVNKLIIKVIVIVWSG
jgi:hypothetical protein